MLNEVRELACETWGKSTEGEKSWSDILAFFFFFKNMKYSFNSLSSKSIPYLFPTLNLTASPKERWKKIWFRIYFESWAKSQLGCIWGVREREKLRITSGFSVLATGWMATSFTGYWHEVGRFLLSLRCFLNPNRDAERAASIGVWVH